MIPPLQTVKKPLGCVEGPKSFDCNPQPATCAAARSKRILLPLSIYDRKNRLFSPGWKAIFAVNVMDQMKNSFC